MADSNGGKPGGFVPKYTMRFNMKTAVSSFTGFNREIEKEASEKLYVISEEEANRRLVNFVVLALFSIAMAYELEAFGYSRFYRLFVFIPWAFAIYHLRSQQTKMCGIAGKGVWDPDGCGIRRIEDPTLKAKLAKKFQELVVSTLTISLTTWALYFFFY